MFLLPRVQGEMIDPVDMLEAVLVWSTKTVRIALWSIFL